MVAIAMVGIAVYRLRRAVGRRIVGLVLIVALTVLAGRAYAPLMTIAISDTQCTNLIVSNFDPTTPTVLTSDCPNLIQIVEIKDPCDFDGACVAFGPCKVGMTLAKGDSCMVPTCS
jgi:hypothetical protein